MNSNHILFATDFSDRDLKALQASCCLALDWGAKLTILYVRDPRDVVKAFDKQVDPKKEFKRFIPDDFGIGFDQIVREGDADEEILKFADENNVSIIALGTHGRRGFDRFIYGSVAEKVMRNAKCPVMTLGETDASVVPTEQQRILVPIDFSVYGYAAIDFASRLATTTNAELTICYVDDTDNSLSRQFPNGRPEWSKKQEEILAQLQEYFPTVPRVRHQHKLLSGSPGKEICTYANSNQYDYIVLGSHGRSGLARAVMGSVAEHVIRNSACPVITVKPSNVRTALPAARKLMR